MKLSEVPQHVVDCRDLNHHWAHDYTLLTEEGYASRVCTCSRCGSLRTELIDLDIGVTLKRKYILPQDYTDVQKHWKRREYRVENIRRALAEEARPRVRTTRKRKEVVKV